MNHPSCIKMLQPTDVKECLVIPKPFAPDEDNRDRSLNRRDLASIANEIFGANKWSHSITSQTLDFVKCTEGRYLVGCSAVVKVQLADGTFHEDLGYSNSNATDEGSAILTARDASVVNALRNALLYFGGGIATRIKDFVQVKSDGVESMTISTIGEPKKIVTLPKPQRMIPNAQSTPHRSRSRSPIAQTIPAVENNNQEIVLPTVDKSGERKLVQPKLPERTKNDDNKVNNKLELQSSNPSERIVRSPTLPKKVENGAKVIKPVLMTEEEKRLERKRRQAQLQEEFRKLHKDKESTVDKPNARF